MLYLYHSHRLEHLADQLAAVAAHPAASPLIRETVIVQSQGMGRWVSLSLAERQGICANVEFVLPASFIWRLLGAFFADLPERSTFAPEVLTFRIMDWLGDSDKLEPAPRLAGYLADGDEFRRFELARRIADVFDQYLMYRPDWIAAWESGDSRGLGPDEAWQSRLWRDLSAAQPESHRSRLMRRLIERLTAGELPAELPEKAAVFGVSSLPPLFLEVIGLLARHLDVHVFALNPCRQEWGQILDRRELARLAGDTDPSMLYLEIGNPLLASLGKHGREFFDQLQDIEVGHWVALDEEEEAGGLDSLLHVLQADVLDLVDRAEAGRCLVHPDDRSLQVHVCHGPMREAEVLHDQLLALFNADPTLAPGDVAVLTPDIEAYSPYIDAVFAERAGTPFIPYGIADRGLAREQPLLDVFIRLLDLPNSRFEADWVLDLLERPTVLRRFGLVADDLPLIRHWVRETGIRWGRDADHKAALGLPATSLHTWREGLRRLLLGYALPQSLAGETPPLFADTVPFDDVEGASALLLGRFAEFIETLCDLAEDLRAASPLPVWADRLGLLIDRMFAPDAEDERSIQALHDALALLRELAEQSGFERPVGLAVAKSWLVRQLRRPFGASGFLSGGVTFCEMIPMRSLPFKVICLIGLNDGAFPRQQRPFGFDLVSRYPRRGDRSRRLDDRYLFLETLLSARQTLYISYVGRSLRDNAELPPSVLVAELIDVARQSCELPDGGDVAGHIVTEHPLQPFSPAYFSGHHRLPGFSGAWLAASRQLGRGELRAQPLFGAALPEPGEDWNAVDFEDLLRFFANPARYLLKRRLDVVLEEGDAVLPVREPFALDFLLRRELREAAWAAWRNDWHVADTHRLAQASGLLPHGDLGRVLYAREHAAVAEKLAPRLAPFLADPALEPLPVDFAGAGTRLSGWLTGVRAGGLLRHCLSDLQPRERLGLWLAHLILSVLRPGVVALESRLVAVDKTLRFGRIDHAEAELAKFLHYYRQGLSRPLPFFIRSAYAYAEAIQDRPEATEDALQRARKVWITTDYSTGESENRYYQAVYRGIDPLNADFRRIALDLLLPMLGAAREE
jgi:exodeoxyribonuclease V gamma subunit